jgi:Na+-driven multidrug efflux pump
MPDAQAAAASATAQKRGRKEYPDGMRYVVIVMLLAIVGSLGSAAVFMLRGRGDSRRMAKALALRVGLSVALFLLLMAGYFFGLFQPGRL